ncbi:MAG: hypothetical protein QGI45_04725 [Myxococcota bacterium]|jgi:hypothetical protein|nr:hypothetical protein [Myxococcota bacterium]
MRNQLNHLLNKALVILLFMANGTCGEGYGTPQKLDRLRVMAIQAAPPSIANNESTTLQALIYQPDDREQELTYQWSWCPFVDSGGEGLTCLVSEDEFAALLGTDAANLSFDLGSNPTATLEHIFDNASLMNICSPENADAAGFFPDCFGGLSVTVRLEINDEKESITAIKRLRLLYDGTPANQNPTFDEVKFLLSNTKLGEEKSRPSQEEEPTIDEAEVLPADGSGRLTTDKTYHLFLDIKEEQSEEFTYWGFDDNAQLIMVPSQEELYISWYITAGELMGARTEYNPPLSELEDLHQNLWRLPADEDNPGNQVSFYFIVHDSRGGVSWTHRSVGMD